MDDDDDGIKFCKVKLDQFCSIIHLQCDGAKWSSSLNKDDGTTGQF